MQTTPRAMRAGATDGRERGVETTKPHGRGTITPTHSKIKHGPTRRMAGVQVKPTSQSGRGQATTTTLSNNNHTMHLQSHHAPTHNQPWQQPQEATQEDAGYRPHTTEQQQQQGPTRAEWAWNKPEEPHTAVEHTDRNSAQAQ